MDGDLDVKLVARTRGGDTESYRLLVERHYPACLRYATRMLGNAADAEEAVQDAFVRAHRFLAGYDAGRPFSRWLFTIVINQCRTLGAARRRVEGTLTSIEVLHDRPSAGPEDDEFSFELQRALLEIPAPVREVVLLKYAEDWSYEDIAEATGVRLSALKMRVKRGREQLKRLLQREDDVDA